MVRWASRFLPMHSSHARPGSARSYRQEDFAANRGTATGGALLWPAIATVGICGWAADSAHTILPGWVSSIRPGKTPEG